jgi:hypothetical protein
MLVNAQRNDPSPAASGTTQASPSAAALERRGDDTSKGAHLLIGEMRLLLRGQGVFFAAQSSADCITNMSGCDLRQARPPPSVARLFLPAM